MIEENSEQANLDVGEGRFALPIREILAGLVRGRVTLCIAFLVPMVIAAVIAVGIPPVYQTEAHLLVLPAQQYAEQPLSADNAPPPSIDSDQISKIEVEILNSQEVRRAAAAGVGVHGLDRSLAKDAASGPDYDRALDIAADEMQ